MVLSDAPNEPLASYQRAGGADRQSVCAGSPAEDWCLACGGRILPTHQEAVQKGKKAMAQGNIQGGFDEAMALVNPSNQSMEPDQYGQGSRGRCEVKFGITRAQIEQVDEL
ncbi:hypothetical protein NDU88_006808 [Pleurodeles waltl]|uniref:Uncharacterized protein n=1 Tax=Pleurodeles waltl TaxID=8319 RepID=A0AAV7VMZ0_PLEWA|nr:hypothetical protein NDU88_006808 [Pleurodeles waltl]